VFLSVRKFVPQLATGLYFRNGMPTRPEIAAKVMHEGLGLACREKGKPLSKGDTSKVTCEWILIPAVRARPP
jgi:hypothetical protein